MTTRIEAAVKAGQSVLVFGPGLPIGDLLASIGETRPPLDLRNPSLEPPRAELRLTVEKHLTADGSLVLMLGTRVSDEIRSVIAEVMEGSFTAAPGRVVRLERGRVLAISPDSAPAPALSDLFGVRIAAARALAVVGSGG